MKLISALLLLVSWVTAGERPNFLVIFTDDQCFRSIGYHNHQVKTPNLNRLAAEGMILKNTYVASPICAASRASVMTGLYPQQHGVVALNTTPFDAFRNDGPRSSQTLANRLTEAGYHCAFAGKSHLGDPQTYGFAEGQESRHPRDIDAFADATKFIEKAASLEKSFFLWLAPRQPHVPLIPGDEWLGLYDEKAIKLDPNFREAPIRDAIYNQGKAGEHYYRDSKYTNNWRKLSAGPPRSEDVMKQFIKAYYATISHLDHQVGMLIHRLDELGMGDDTLIIYLSDNGYHLGNHGLGNKITMHEESVRVPMWLRWKGTIQANQESSALVSSLDVYATLLDYAGVRTEKDWAESRSMKSLCEDPSIQHRLAVYSECTGVGGGKGEGHRMIRMQEWKLILNDQNQWHFHDILRDPYELRNLYDKGDAPSKVRWQTLQAPLHGWMKRIGDRRIPAKLLQ